MQIIKQVNGKQKGKFVRKASNVIEVVEEIKEGFYDHDEFIIEEVIVLSEDEMEKFKYDFFDSYEWLKGKGGIDSDYEPEREVEDFFALTDEEKEKWRAKAYRVCVAVVSKDEMYAVDPQGYDYARYVAIMK